MVELVWSLCQILLLERQYLNITHGVMHAVSGSLSKFNLTGANLEYYSGEYYSGFLFRFNKIEKKNHSFHCLGQYLCS